MQAGKSMEVVGVETGRKMSNERGVPEHCLDAIRQRTGGPVRNGAGTISPVGGGTSGGIRPQGQQRKQDPLIYRLAMAKSCLEQL